MNMGANSCCARTMDEGDELEKLNSTAGYTQVPASAQRCVFISYASLDAALAQKVCSAVEAAGFPCWIAPRDVLPRCSVKTRTDRQLI